MVGLFFVIFLALTLLFFEKYVKESKKGSKNENVCNTYSLISTIFAVICFAFLILVFLLVAKLGVEYTISEKISMYEAENLSVEQSIDETVKNYMSFEASTYAEIKDKDAMNLISLFPELQTDTLVKQQIEVYIENNKKIKELKEKKINISLTKWLLYFGR